MFSFFDMKIKKGVSQAPTQIVLPNIKIDALNNKQKDKKNNFKKKKKSKARKLGYNTKSKKKKNKK